jgi:hypothetical protein
LNFRYGWIAAGDPIASSVTVEPHAGLGAEILRRRSFEMADDEGAIGQVVETWMSASKSGDLSTVLALMTDDVIFMVPGQ